MRLLSISDPQIWLLAGISVLVVFSILLILVLILGIFTAIAKKTTAKKTEAGAAEAASAEKKPAAKKTTAKKTEKAE